MEIWFILFMSSLPWLARANTVSTSNSVAASRAVGYIWSQADKSTFLWPEGEIGPGILGVAGYNPTNEGGRFKNITEQLIMTANIEALGAEFLLKTLTPVRGQTGLSNVDLPSLIQYIAVNQITCRNPFDYYGHDLVQHAVGKLDEVTHQAPTFGFLVLAICNSNKEDLMKKVHFEKLTRSVPAFGHLCPFCVERSAINIMALACLANKDDDALPIAASVKPSSKNLRGHIAQYAKYIDGVQEKDGGFGSIFSTTLAIQAKLSTKVKFTFDLDASWKYLKNAQKADGSFGEAVTFTAMSIPALTAQTFADFRRIQCDNYLNKGEPSPTFRVAYELEDAVFSQQKFRARLEVARGAKLLKALEDYSNNNPTVLKIATEKSGSGVRLKSINGIANDESATTFWFVDEVHKDGKVVPVSSLLDSTTVKEDALYRLSYRTSKLSL